MDRSEESRNEKVMTLGIISGQQVSSLGSATHSIHDAELQPDTDIQIAMAKKHDRIDFAQSETQHQDLWLLGHTMACLPPRGGATGHVYLVHWCGRTCSCRRERTTWSVGRFETQ